MFEISDKIEIAQDTFSVWVEVPKIAENAKAGQFVIVMAEEDGERIPLTIADKKGSKIRLIFQVVGKSTKKMAEVENGQSYAHVALKTFRNRLYTVLLVGGNWYCSNFPILKALNKLETRLLLFRC